MSLTIEYDSICGTDHLESGQNNQDAIAIRHNNNSGVIVLADGAGSRKYAEIGARAVAETAADYLSENIKKIFIYDSKKIRKKLYSIIINELNALAEKYKCIGIRKFGSTLMFAAVHENKYIIGHLGDGSIIGCYKGNYPVLFFPETGSIKNSTFLTTSLAAEKHLRIKKGETSVLEGLILLSDGILPYLFKSEYILRHKESLPITLRKANKVKFTDDASYALIKWRNIYV